MSRATAAWKAVKVLLHEAAYALPSAYAYLEDQLTSNDSSATPLEWRRFHIVGTQLSPAGFSDDAAGFKLDVVNYTSGNWDSTWTDADHTAVHNALYALCTGLLPFTAPTFTFTTTKAYRMSFSDVPDVKRPFSLTGPPVWTASHGAGGRVGTGTVVHPAQVAASITFNTGIPKHWGRAYMPHFGKALDSYGRFTAADVELLSDLWTTCFDTLTAAEFFPVVPIGQLAKQPFHALQSIADVQVDDVPDVIRRRRPKRAAIRAHSDPL